MKDPKLFEISPEGDIKPSYEGVNAPTGMSRDSDLTPPAPEFVNPPKTSPVAAYEREQKTGQGVLDFEGVTVEEVKAEERPLTAREIADKAYAEMWANTKSSDDIRETITQQFGR